MILLASFLEPFYILYQIAFSVKLSQYGILSGGIISFIGLVVSNILFFSLYRRNIVKDPIYKYWNFKVLKFTLNFHLLFNFKSFRLLYCKFAGLKYFQAPFSKDQVYLRPLLIITVVYFLLCLVPLIITDIVCFFYISWNF